MKYIVISPRKVAQRIRYTSPAQPDVVSIEVTDEVAATVQAIMDANEQVIYTGGAFISTKSHITSGKMVRFDEDTKEWAITPRPVPVPKEVPLWAFREVVFLDDGLEPAYNAFMAVLLQQDPSTHARVTNFIDYGNYIVRASTALDSLANAIGKDDAYIDSVFIRAEKKVL